MRLMSLNDALNTLTPPQKMQDKKSTELAEILKDIEQDEFGTYEPTQIQKILAGYEGKSEIYEALESEMMKGMLFYGSDPASTMSSEELFRVDKNDPAWVIALKLEVQPKLGILNDSIYQRAFYQQNDEAKELQEFLRENPIEGFDLANRSFVKSAEKDDNRLELLFADEEMQIEDFKREYLKLAHENDVVPSDGDREDNNKKKGIEAKSDNLRESMDEILGRLDLARVKNERDLLAIYLAYKDSERLFDKRA